MNNINSLGTMIFCWNFRLVNADLFFYEYLVQVLCYRSQTCLIFHHWVAALDYTQVAVDAPPTAEMKPVKCCDLVNFSPIFVFGAGCWEALRNGGSFGECKM